MPAILFCLIVFIIGKRISNSKNRQEKNKEKDVRLDTEHPKKYDTGWYWDEDAQLWRPPGFQKEPENRAYKPEITYKEWLEKQGKQPDTTHHFEGTQVSSETINIPTQEKQNTYTKPVEKPKPEPKPIPNKNTAKFQNAYEATNILTKNESDNYKKLKIAADKKGYIICPKVRLADIVKPRNDPQYMSRFGKIKSKHVDFVIYDENMRHLKAVIELDDSSHDRKDRQERDEFVDFILRDCGYKVIHTRYITPDILDNV